MSKLSPPQRSSGAHSGFRFFAQRLTVQQVEKCFHLRGKATSVAEPPRFLSARHPVRVNIFYADHLVQPPTSVSAAKAARFDASVRRFADAEARYDIVDHH